MIKKSYTNKSVELPVEHSGKALYQPDSYSGSEHMIGRGYSAPGEKAEPIDDDLTINDEEIVMKTEKNNHKFDRLSKYLIGLSDDLDKEGHYRLASFSDFLIKKIADAKKADYESLLKDILVSISNTDNLNKNNIILSISKNYNKLYLRLLKEGSSSEEAHMQAYQSAANEAEEYILKNE